MQFNIALTGGGTAGHIMPNIALFPHLKKYFSKIIYIGSKNSMEEQICNKNELVYYSTSTVKYTRNNIFKNFEIPFTLFKGILEAKKILKKENINVVFSKGGYAALPTVFAAHGLGIPVICHESDKTIGMANKITARFADKVYTAFDGTYKNAAVVPTPIRDTIFEGKMLPLFFTNKKPVLLFMGGSLGAEAINKVVEEALPQLTQSFNVIHIAGKKKQNIRADQQQKGEGDYICVDFCDNIQDYFATADVIICRAGASTLAEVTALGKRTIAIPLPKGASRGDQIENAEYYKTLDVITIIEQDKLSPTTLLFTINSILMMRAPTPTYNRQIPQIISEDLFSYASMDI